MSRTEFMADPRRVELAASYASLLADESGARERYGIALIPYVEAWAEYTDGKVSRAIAMRSCFTALQLPLAAIAVGFKATGEEIDALMASLPQLTSTPDDAVARLRAMPYADYLRTEHWRRVRSAALRRYEYRCALCASPKRLEVHHRTYVRLGCERDADVAVLCSNCHSHHHEAKAA